MGDKERLPASLNGKLISIKNAEKRRPDQISKRKTISGLDKKRDSDTIRITAKTELSLPRAHGKRVGGRCEPILRGTGGLTPELNARKISKAFRRAPLPRRKACRSQRRLFSQNGNKGGTAVKRMLYRP